MKNSRQKKMPGAMPRFREWKRLKRKPGVVGLGKAVEILQEIGFDKNEEHEKVLNRKLIDGLKQFDNIIIYGDTENIDDRVGVVTFNFSDINSYILATKLTDLGGIATRRGAFCANFTCGWEA